MHDLFRKFAVYVSRVVGSIWAFLIFICLILITGYYFDFSNDWKSNVGFMIAIITLCVVFFLQNSQNHSDKATHLKLDELIKAIEGARNEVVSVEDQGEKHLDNLKESVMDKD